MFTIMSGAPAAAGTVLTFKVTAANGTTKIGADSSEYRTAAAGFGVFNPTDWDHPTLGIIGIGTVNTELAADRMHFGLDGLPGAPANNDATFREFTINGIFDGGLQYIRLLRSAATSVTHAGNVGTSRDWSWTVTAIGNPKLVIGNIYNVKMVF